MLENFLNSSRVSKIKRAAVAPLDHKRVSSALRRGSVRVRKREALRAASKWRIPGNRYAAQQQLANGRRGVYAHITRAKLKRIDAGLSKLTRRRSGWVFIFPWSRRLTASVDLTIFVFFFFSYSFKRQLSVICLHYRLLLSKYRLAFFVEIMFGGKKIAVWIKLYNV